MLSGSQNIGDGLACLSGLSDLRNSVDVLIRQGNFRRMQVGNLPASGPLMKNDGSPVYESMAVIQMKGGDGNVTEHLNFKRPAGYP